MLKHDRFKERDKKNILIILSIFSVLGNLIDLFVIEFPQIIALVNIVSIILVILIFFLENFSVINKSQAFWIIIYLLIINILLSHFLDTGNRTDVDLLRSILIICVLIPVSAFAIDKIHAIYILFILTVFIISLNIITGSEYLSKNIYILILVIIGYSLGIYYLINLLELRSKNEQLLIEKIKENNNDTFFLKTLAFEMMDFASEKETIPKILKSVKEYTKAGLTVFSIYDSDKKELKVSSIEAEGTLLKTVVNLAGEKILATSSPVNQETYNEIIQEVIGIRNSLNEVSFGAIPVTISTAFKKLTGISHYYGVAHIISGKLYGTTMLAFKSNQNIPSQEFLESYAHLSALLLRRTLLEKKLRASENNLRSITDNITDVVFRSDMNFRASYISPSIKNLTGDTPETYQKKRLRELYTPESVDKIKAAFQEELKKEKDPKVDKNRTRIIELTILNEKGKKVHVSIHLSFMRDEKGKATGFQGVIRDISDIKKSEAKLKAYSEELKLLNSDKDRFMKILAHDLRSPFNTILGFSNLLLNNFEKYDNDVVLKNLNLIKNASQKTYNLLDDLLLWSKSQSGMLPFEPGIFEFNEICLESIEEQKELAMQKDITLECKLTSKIYIQSDKNLLKTILRNLLSNAIKFTQKKGNIDILAEYNENSTLITVADNGIGMGTNEISNIWNFEKSYTNVGTAQEKGTGFGLVICKEFVEKHGGKIWIESKKGVGSKFIFSLPINKEELNNK